MRSISIPSGGVSKAVYFPIVPTKIGDVILSVTAQSAVAGDAVEQVLRVEVSVSAILSFTLSLIKCIADTDNWTLITARRISGGQEYSYNDRFDEWYYRIKKTNQYAISN